MEKGRECREDREEGGESGDDGSEEDEEKEKVVESFLVLVSEIPGQRVGCMTLRGGRGKDGREELTHP